MRIDAHAKFPERECPNCAVRVAANQNRCPICAYVFPTPRWSVFSRMRVPAALLLLALMLWMVGRSLL